jgi:hypothetical protein
MPMCICECFCESVIFFMNMKRENNFDIEAQREREIEFPIVKIALECIKLTSHPQTSLVFKTKLFQFCKQCYEKKVI